MCDPCSDGLNRGIETLARVDNIRGAVGGRPQERKESPIDVLERRFAEGAISVEDYRARREVLGNGTAESSDAHDKEALTTPRA
jgi:hypothetical protein